ncbi:hypothetical protein WMF45_28835 [Sorangium sp. So ce448]|uniref:hypothetical protein n=1 Tax=Sorangium sp. So ce448 TaxID=3133314 RepID=UPI003F5DA9F6
MRTRGFGDLRAHLPRFTGENRQKDPQRGSGVTARRGSDLGAPSRRSPAASSTRSSSPSRFDREA